MNLSKEQENILKNGVHSDLASHLDGLAIERKAKQDRSLFKRGVAAGMLASVALFPAIEDRSEQSPKALTEQTYSVSGEVKQVEPTSRIERIFNNDIAQDAADYLGIKGSDYFIASDQTMDSIAEKSDWWQNDQLLPIFPPSVYQYKDLFEEAGHEYGINPNFLATIAFIETSGANNLQSPADAHGVMQFVPRYHIERFKDLGFLPDDASYEDYMSAKESEGQRYEMYLASFNNPRYSIIASGDFFSELLDQARSELGVADNHPLIYARAAGAYNGGPSRLTGALKGLPDETAEYVTASQRMILDIAVANEVAKSTDDIYESVADISDEFAGYNFLLRSMQLNERLDFEFRNEELQRIVNHIFGANDTVIEAALNLYNSGNARIRDYTSSRPGALAENNRLQGVPPGGLSVNQLRAIQTPYTNPVS